MQLLALAFVSLCLLNGVQPLLRLTLGRIPSSLLEGGYCPIDGKFYGNITIGTPPQPFRVLFTTSSPLLHVPSKNCTEHFCIKHKKYDSSKSTTYVNTNKTFDEKTKIGNVSGILSQDIVTVAEKQVKAQVFGEILHLPMKEYDGGDFDGVLGFGFSPVNTFKPLLQNLKEQGYIDAQIFSFYLNKTGNLSSSGVLYFGGSDAKSYKAPINYVPLSKNDSWQFKMDKFEVEGKKLSLCTSGCEASIDMVNSKFRGPTADIAKLASAIGATIDHSGLYTLNCSTVPTLPALNFYINGNKYTLTAEDYVHILIPYKFSICALNFVGIGTPAPSEPQWIFGDVFMSKYYTEFDMGKKRIGFAELLTHLG